LALVEGSLYPITAVGALTIQRLRLNRSALLAYRGRKQSESEDGNLLARYRNNTRRCWQSSEEIVGFHGRASHWLEERCLWD
jgi:hypothetical protein